MNFAISKIGVNLKEFFLFLFILPLIFFPPAFLAVILVLSKECTAKEGATRKLRLFAFVPEKINGRWHWLRFFEQPQIYQQIGKGPFGIRVMGWRNQSKEETK